MTPKAKFQFSQLASSPILVAANDNFPCRLVCNNLTSITDYIYADGVNLGNWQVGGGHVFLINTPLPFLRVTGFGTGSSEAEVCTIAKYSATQSAPRDTYPRHCQCKCSKK